MNIIINGARTPHGGVGGEGCGGVGGRGVGVGGDRAFQKELSLLSGSTNPSNCCIWNPSPLQSFKVLV